MRLHAVVVPPLEVLRDCLDKAQSISLVPVSRRGEPRAGLLGRMLRRETAAASSPDLTLTVVPSEEGFVRLARFGNVTLGDAHSLAQVLGEAAGSWPVPEVYVAGLVLDTTVPRPVITAQLGGDTDGLQSVFAHFHEVARQQRFFLDRRSFRPEFTVATLDLPDDPSLRQRIRFNAHDHRGPDWRAARISMMRVSFDSTAEAFEEVASVPLGGAG